MIEALLKCLNKVDKTKVFRTTEAANIWSCLDKEYGHISDMRRNIAGTALYTLRKDPTISMEDYINKFTGLIQEIDLHRPKEIPEMSIAKLISLSSVPSAKNTKPSITQSAKKSTQ